MENKKFNILRLQGEETVLENVTQKEMDIFFIGREKTLYLIEEVETRTVIAEAVTKAKIEFVLEENKNKKTIMYSTELNGKYISESVSSNKEIALKKYEEIKAQYDSLV